MCHTLWSYATIFTTHNLWSVAMLFVCGLYKLPRCQHTSPVLLVGVITARWRLKQWSTRREFVNDDGDRRHTQKRANKNKMDKTEEMYRLRNEKKRRKRRREREKKKRTDTHPHREFDNTRKLNSRYFNVNYIQRQNEHWTLNCVPKYSLPINVCIVPRARFVGWKKYVWKYLQIQH